MPRIGLNDQPKNGYCGHVEVRHQHPVPNVCFSLELSRQRSSRKNMTKYHLYSWPKARSGQIRVQQVQTGSKWPKLVPRGSKRSKQGPRGPQNRSQEGPRGPNVPQVAKTGPKRAPTGPNRGYYRAKGPYGARVPNRVEMCRKMVRKVKFGSKFDEK